MTPPALLSPLPRPRRRGRLRWALVLATAAAGTVLFDATLSLTAIHDGFFRGVPLPPYGPFTHPRQREWLERTAAAPPVGLGAFDPELGWTVTPGFESAEFSSNSLGARGAREYAPQHPPGVLRLATYGDSFTFCDQVADRDTWQAILERLDPRIEAINLGVGGYGTDQALLRFRRRGRLDADVVTIGILLENIGRNVNRYRPLWYTRARAAAAKPRFVLDGEQLLLIPIPYRTRAEMFAAVQSGAVLADLAEHEHWRSPRLGLLEHSSLARLAAAWWCRRERDVERLWLDRGGEPRRVTIALLLEFQREALAAGARAAPVLVFPRERDLESIADSGQRYWTQALEELEAQGVAVIDLSVPLYRAWRRARESGAAERVYTGGHLSARSNGVVAAALSKWLREHGPRPR